MINLQLIVAAASQFWWWGVQEDLAVAAFAFAELGFLVVWAIAGHGKWYWRVPVTLSIALFIFSWWYRLGTTLGHGHWHALLVIELVSIAMLAAALRVARFRLHTLDDMRRDSRNLQFGLRHLLVLTTVLTVILGAARAAEMLTLPDHDRTDLLQMAIPRRRGPIFRRRR